ncbi:MAG: MFS transporter, partial [Thaumarchaeota archaeon]|nr:MFS transporter [Nitrososphaerota archaeon]
MTETRASIITVSRGLLRLGNIRVLALTSMTTGVYLSLLGTILQPFVVSDLGFSVTILGILVSIGSRPLGLASSIVQPFTGYLSDVLGRKLLIAIGSAVGVSSMLFFLLAAATHNLLPLSLGYTLLGLSLLGNPATQAMIAETVEMDPGRLNVAFSVVFFFTALPGAIIPFAAGYLVQTFGFVLLFAAAGVLESVNLLVMIPQLRETRAGPVPTGEQTPRRKFSFSRATLPPRGLVKLFIPFAMDAFFYGVGGAIIYGVWAKQFGFTAGDIGLIFGTLSVSIVLSQYPATKLLLKIGTRRTLALSEALTVVIMFGWLVTDSLPVYILLSIIFGISVALWVPAISALFMRAAPVEERGGISGKLAAFRGLIAVPAPFLGGLLYSTYGYYVPVFIGMAGEAVTVVALLKL